MALPQFQDVPEPIRLYVDQQVDRAKQEMAQRLVDNQTEMERYYAVRYDEVLREVREMREDQRQILAILETQSATLAENTATLAEHTTILRNIVDRLDANGSD